MCIYSATIEGVRAQYASIYAFLYFYSHYLYKFTLKIIRKTAMTRIFYSHFFVELKYLLKSLLIFLHFKHLSSIPILLADVFQAYVLQALVLQAHAFCRDTSYNHQHSTRFKPHQSASFSSTHSAEPQIQG